MKDFSSWGIKVRKFPEYNYHAVWSNLKTIRLGKGSASPLPPNCSEFYDVSLGTKCNCVCPWCYVGASASGRYYKNVSKKIKAFFNSMDSNSKPFQIAIGSESEPTIHPEFLDFIKTVYDCGVVPNYTTNGITLAADNEYSKTLLEYTTKYCGGVAVSANTFNESINKTWRKAIEKLSSIDVNINLHYIISDKESVNKFIEIYNAYKDKVLYFVLLPLMESGRSKQSMTKEAFDYLIEQDIEWSQVAFGAHFYEYLKAQNKIECWMFPPESFSKNLILEGKTNDSIGVKITPSSFDLNPIMELEFNDVDESRSETNMIENHN